MINNNLAGWKFVKTQQPQYQIGKPFHNRYQLQFRTKNYLNTQLSKIRQIRQVRQHIKDGSTLHIQFQLLQNQGYKTAGNIAVYPENDANLVEKIIIFFQLDVESVFDVEFNQKKSKLNFCTPIKMKNLLTKYIDLQSPITKSLLKNLGKLPSNNPKYFLENSSPKTTQEYTRLTTQFTYLFQILQKFQVEMNFQTFISLSNGIAPRLFTIASSQKYNLNISIVNSLSKNGLCSKFFNNQSTKEARIQLRQSSFKDPMNKKNLLFISAGAGFAPFRGYLQQKQLLMKQKKECPYISLLFGCKYSQGDFIYKDQITKWVDSGVINKFYPAFSRDQQTKVYVQNILSQNLSQLQNIFSVEQGALYYCGSPQMGKGILQELIKFFKKEGKSQEQAKKLILKYEGENKIIKQLW